MKPRNRMLLVGLALVAFMAGADFSLLDFFLFAYAGAVLWALYVATRVTE